MIYFRLILYLILAFYGFSLGQAIGGTYTFAFLIICLISSILIFDIYDKRILKAVENKNRVLREANEELAYDNINLKIRLARGGDAHNKFCRKNQ